MLFMGFQHLSRKAQAKNRIQACNTAFSNWVILNSLLFRAIFLVRQWFVMSITCGASCVILPCAFLCWWVRMCGGQTQSLLLWLLKNKTNKKNDKAFFFVFHVKNFIPSDSLIGPRFMMTPVWKYSKNECLLTECWYNLFMSYDSI